MVVEDANKVSLDNEATEGSVSVESVAPVKEELNTHREDDSVRNGDAAHEALRGEPASKFGNCRIKTDPLQDDKASEIRLCSVERPHMRAFHYAWWCYHVAFLMW